MKKNLKIFILLLTALFLASGSAMALNFGDDYWTLTDLTTANSDFSIKFEYADYESDFGLYMAPDSGNDPIEYLIFDKNQEPDPNVTRIVNFQQLSGQWQAQLQEESYDSSLNLVTTTVRDWEDFDVTFGFYFGVYTGGQSDTSLDYLWYTDTAFNQYANGTSVDTNVEHVATAYNADTHRVVIYLDDQLDGGDRDFNDMVVAADDLEPVPEPTTILLSGLGLLGMGAYLRRRKNLKV